VFGEIVLSEQAGGSSKFIICHGPVHLTVFGLNIGNILHDSELSFGYKLKLNLKTKPVADKDNIFLV